MLHRNSWLVKQYAAGELEVDWWTVLVVGNTCLLNSVAVSLVFLCLLEVEWKAELELTEGDLPHFAEITDP